MTRITIAQLGDKAFVLKSRRNKMGNIKTEYNGVKFDSKKEASFARELDTLLHARFEAERVVSYERQVKYPFELNGVKIGEYWLDFKVTYGDGRVEHIDVKGFKTDVYKLKKKMMRAFYGIDIIEK